MRFVSMLGLSLGMGSRKSAFVVLSGLAVTMFVVTVGRYNLIVMWEQTVNVPIGQQQQQNMASKLQNLELESCPVGNSSSAKKMCLRYEVYVILTRSGNSMADIDVMRQLLAPSECRLTSVYLLHLVSYDDSSAARTANQTAGLLQGAIEECAMQGSSVRLDFKDLSDRKRSVSALNKMMMDSYVFEDIDFVSVIFSGGFGAGSPPLATAAEFVGALARSRPKYVGAGFQGGADARLAPGRVFFSRTHFEIFGFFLPAALTKLEDMPAFFQLVYSNRQLTTMITATTSSTTTTTTDVVVRPISKQSLLELNLSEYEAVLRKYIRASALNPCLRCVSGAGRMVVAMSLYGSNPRYTMGAVRNAQLLPVAFPGWRLWLYAEKPNSTGHTKYDRVPDRVIAKLEDLGAEIVWVDVAGVGLAPMLWRFTVMDDPAVDVFVVRDCDSRLTSRDAAVVSDWLKTDRLFHCIRDHPSHSNYAVSGGLWGARRQPLRRLVGNLSNVMRRYGAGYVQDMDFLGNDVWPKVKDHAYCHDSFSCHRYPSSHPFPVARIGYEHLGQVYDQFSVGRQNDVDILKRSAVNRKCVPI